MTTLRIMRGYSGSGKTTLAKAWVAEDPDSRARVNRDDIRAMLGIPGKGSWDQEQRVTKVQRATVTRLLEGGCNVVVDDTNLVLRFARNWADLAAELGVDFEVVDVKTHLNECLIRDRTRQSVGLRGTGAEVIQNQASRFPISQWRPVTRRGETKAPEGWTPYAEPTKSCPSIYLVDIDGTLAKKRQGPGERGWHEYDRVAEDLPNPGVIELVARLRETGVGIVFMSGRKEHCREQTLTWLEEHLGWIDIAEAPLFMREDQDNRPDDIVKHELFHRYVQGEYDVRGVIDDRDRVVAMWRAIGLTTLQVDYGNF